MKHRGVNFTVRKKGNAAPEQQHQQFFLRQGVFEGTQQDGRVTKLV